MDRARRLDAVDPRHAHVHQHDVGRELLGLRDRLFAVLGFGDHLDAVFGVQHDIQPAAEQRLVIRD